MDEAWLAQLMEKLGPRYRRGRKDGDGCELDYRFSKTEFRPSRVVVGEGAEGHGIRLALDFRVPKGSSVIETEPLVSAVEKLSLVPRGFTREGESTQKMSSDLGEDSGFVRTVHYIAEGGEPAETAKRIRAIVESIDIPIVVGIHEPNDLLARDPPPERKRIGHVHLEPIEQWEYQLERGLVHSITVVVDPNVRTLRVVERKLVSKRDLVDVLKLAHVAKFGLRRQNGSADLVAVKRDGTEVLLARAQAKEAFVSTAERLAKKVMIPIERL